MALKSYTIFWSDKAKEDVNELRATIEYDFSAPITAARYINGLLKKIKELEYTAEMLAVSASVVVRSYGYNARRINYKKMAIIYTVHDDTVTIHRVMPQAMVIAGM